MTQGSAPAFGVVGFHGAPRALLVGGIADCGVRSAGEPASTVVATVWAKAAMERSCLVGGRVVSLTPRALARLMGLDDAYTLPTRRVIASRILGNGVCPPVAAALAGQFLALLREGTEP